MGDGAREDHLEDLENVSITRGSKRGDHDWGRIGKEQKDILAIEFSTKTPLFLKGKFLGHEFFSHLEVVRDFFSFCQNVLNSKNRTWIVKAFPRLFFSLSSWRY